MLTPFIANAQSGYEFFIIDTLKDGELDSCTKVDSECSLNSAISIAQETELKTVLFYELPYKEGGEVKQIPFYIVNEVSDEWKILPAPLVSTSDLTNLDQNITDYFLTLNIGNLQINSDKTFISSLFFGQFRKFHNPENTSLDYDTKSPIYRIVNIPSDPKFSDSNEMREFLEGVESGELDYQKLVLNGWYLRIYEESLSQAVFAIVFTLTLLVILLNFLVFPNLILYLILYIQGIRKSKFIGLIYSKDDNQPISLAILKIYKNMNGQRTFLKQVITDFEGRYYGVGVERGSYIIEVKHNEFMNFEKEVQIFESEGIIATDIGLSSAESSYEKGFIDNIKSFILSNIKNFNKILVYFNILIALLNLLLAQNIANLAILAISLAQFLLYKRLSRRRNWGVVLDSSNNRPISNAIVKVYKASDLTQTTVQMSDEKGRFGFILKNEEYLISVQSIGYKFPSNRDHNPKYNAPSGESMIKLIVPQNKRINLIIYLDKIV